MESDTIQLVLSGLPEGVHARTLFWFLNEKCGGIMRVVVKTFHRGATLTGKRVWLAFIDCLSGVLADELESQVNSGALKFGNHLMHVRRGKPPKRRRDSRRAPVKLVGATLELACFDKELVDKKVHEIAWSAWIATKGGLTLDFDFGARGVQFQFVVREAEEGMQEDVGVVKTPREDDDVMLACNLRDLKRVSELQDGGGRFDEQVLLIELHQPPKVYCRGRAESLWKQKDFEERFIWFADDAADPQFASDPWIRTTDFTDRKYLSRCLCYLVRLPLGQGPQVAHIQQELAKLGIAKVTPPPLRKPILRDVAVRKRELPPLKPPLPILPLDLPFDFAFQAHSLVGQGVISEHSLDWRFCDILLQASKSPLRDTALTALHELLIAPPSNLPLANAPQAFLDKMQDLSLQEAAEHPKVSPRLADNLAPIRRVVITPNKAYLLGPSLEPSNRIVRMYSPEFLLRVAFCEEDFQPLGFRGVLNVYLLTEVRERFMDVETEVMERIKALCHKGFDLFGRHYEFLACSSNQLRSRSCWFMWGSRNHIERTWQEMGNFKGFKSVAKFMARMGQCFSSSTVTLKVLPGERLQQADVKTPDNRYTFTDGVGRITLTFAQQVAEKLGLPETPSMFQIRWGGCKGMVAVDPLLKGHKIATRPSMEKFQSSHTDFEVLGWSVHLPAYINRQIIVLLTALGVPEEHFEQLQAEHIGRLRSIVKGDNLEETARTLELTCELDLRVAISMLRGGFSPDKEPFLKLLLKAVQASQMHDLRTKARAFVEHGRWMYGGTDESQTLEYGQCFIQVTLPTFLQARDLPKRVITGTVIVAKNPCLHPGDIRILEAVDVPGLRHLHDCLIFPQKGDRPHSDECSGSDLDGDKYFVAWETRLIPPGKKSAAPLELKPQEERKLHGNRDATIQDGRAFFCKSMLNDSLGQMSNWHLVHADLDPEGANSAKCLELAEAAAIAVDYPKTGFLKPVGPELRPHSYPDFMEKHNNEESYLSFRVLGRMYRTIKGEADEPSQSSAPIYNFLVSKSYDADLEYPGHEGYLEEAFRIKKQYEMALSNLMFEYGVQDEAQVVSGMVILMSKFSMSRKGDMKERLKLAYHHLRKHYRGVLEEDNTPEGPLNEISSSTPQSVEVASPETPRRRSAKEKAAAQALADEADRQARERLRAKASACYIVTYEAKWLRKKKWLKSRPPMLSFAWLLADVLAEIKRHKFERNKETA